MGIQWCALTGVYSPALGTNNMEQAERQGIFFRSPARPSNVFMAILLLMTGFLFDGHQAWFDRR